MDVALLRQALEKHEQNLATLEVQKANYGIAVPAYCLIHKSNHSKILDEAMRDVDRRRPAWYHYAGRAKIK